LEKQKTSYNKAVKNMFICTNGEFERGSKIIEQRMSQEKKHFCTNLINFMTMAVV
jgi:hypothetical protein